MITDEGETEHHCRGMQEREMGSWVKCHCGALVHKNLFAGANVTLLVTDDFLDRDFKQTTADELIADILARCKISLNCKKCDRLIIVDDRGTDPDSYYVPEST